MKNVVSLSKRDESFLSNINDAKVREATRLSILAKKQETEEKRAAKREEYLASKNTLEFSETENGYLLIKGTGTGRWALFSPEQAHTAFVRNIKELQALVIKLQKTDK
jgi:hypothetical protein